MELRCFAESFAKTFWLEDDYAVENFTESYPNEATVNSIEEELGWKLPGSYIEMMRVQNGGYPANTHLILPSSLNSESEYLCMEGFFAIGR